MGALASALQRRAVPLAAAALTALLLGVVWLQPSLGFSSSSSSSSTSEEHRLQPRARDSAQWDGMWATLRNETHAAEGKARPSAGTRARAATQNHH